MLRYAIVIACLFVAACGSDDDEPSPPVAQQPATALTVTVWPEGRGGPSRERRVECPGHPACRDLSAAKLQPLPGDTPCTAIYGGPDEARVRGTIDGERVDFDFSREDGCQINRWDENVALLGKPSGRL
jgi:hypothetical protein